MPQAPSDTLRGVLATFALILLPSLALAQGEGTITGKVTRLDDNSPLPSVSVTVRTPQTSVTTVTGPDGQFTLRRVPEGPQTVTFRWLGYRPTEVQTTVQAGETATVNVGLQPLPVALTELVVSAPSRAPRTPQRE